MGTTCWLAGGVPTEHMLAFLLRRRTSEAGGRVARIGLVALFEDCSVFES